MNTTKQINIMVILIFVSLIATGLYWMWDAGRADDAEARQMETSIERGAYLFSQNCRVCHGDSGEGGQASNRLRAAPALNRPDLQGVDPETGEVSDQLKQQQFTLVINTLTCGRVGTAMPVWGQSQGGTLSDEQMRQLALLITEGTQWEEAEEFAIHGFPPGDVHGDGDVGFSLGGPVSEEDLEIVISLGDQGVIDVVVGDRIQLGEELIGILAIITPSVEVERGSGAAAHNAGAAVWVNGADRGITLSEALTEDAETIVVSTVQGISAGDELQIGEETLTVTQVNDRNYFEVERGIGNTQPAEHEQETEVIKRNAGVAFPVEPVATVQAACGQTARPVVTATPEPPAAETTITSQGIAFDKVELFMLPGVPLTVNHIHNDPGQQHNWALYTTEDAALGGEAPLATSDIIGDPATQVINFGPLEAGEYYYQCDVHTAQMNGILYVQEATDAEGDGAAADETPVPDGAEVPPADGADAGTGETVDPPAEGAAETP